MSLLRKIIQLLCSHSFHTFVDPKDQTGQIYVVRKVCVKCLKQTNSKEMKKDEFFKWIA